MSDRRTNRSSEQPRSGFWVAGLFLASGSDIFKVPKIVGHSSVAITQPVYADLHPDAFAEDYSGTGLS